MFFSNLKIPFGFLVRTGAGSGGNRRWIWRKQALDVSGRFLTPERVKK